MGTHAHKPGMRAGIGAVALALVAGLTLTAAPSPAGAGGGDLLYPHRDRYEPGQAVMMVGYTEPVANRSNAEGDPVQDPDWRTPGPYYAYLRVDPEAVARDAQPASWPSVHPTDVRLGRVEAEDIVTANALRSLRVRATFRLPQDLAPATYTVLVCNDPCTTTLGWLFDFAFVHVGVDPASPVVREWALDDPAVRRLEGDALLVDPGGNFDSTDPDDWTVTAAEVRAGYRAGPTIASPPTTVATTTVPSPPAREPVDVSPAVRAAEDSPGGISGEVVGWLVGFGVLLVVWSLAWRLRPGGGRIVVRRGGDPPSPTGGQAARGSAP
ncbi:MAG TPA: hypothetical protein VE575_11310 [Acidimicrobiales bacterium]|nr:hypothetical protein [Acidimicrobiales bacterium]